MSMSHPFEIGKTYRNRAGEYVVQAIEGDWMKIRYTSGGTLETRVSLQARIWENIQFEKQMAREDERLRQAREARLAARQRKARARREARIKFEGFEESDFEPKRRGIAWSDRQDLGKVLARTLTQRVEGKFQSWIVPRQPKIHVARAEYYHRESIETNAAFFVAADEKGVLYGFRVGKPDGETKAQLPWAAFVEALDDGKMRRSLRAAMKDHDLSLDVYATEVSYGQVGQITVQSRGFLFEHETAEQEISRRMNWADLTDYLQTVATGQRCNLYLCTRLSPEDALRAGAGLSDQIADVLAALVPLYDASVGA